MRQQQTFAEYFRRELSAVKLRGQTSDGIDDKQEISSTPRNMGLPSCLTRNGQEPGYVASVLTWRNSDFPGESSGKVTLTAKTQTVADFENSQLSLLEQLLSSGYPLLQNVFVWRQTDALFESMCKVMRTQFRQIGQLVKTVILMQIGGNMIEHTAKPGWCQAAATTFRFDPVGCLTAAQEREEGVKRGQVQDETSFYHGTVTRFRYRTIRPLRSIRHDQAKVSLDGFGGGNHRGEQRAALVYDLASTETDRNAHAGAAYSYGHVDVVLRAAL